jgi:hypothetical protein
MLRSFQACTRGAAQQGRRWLQLADHKELCDLSFLALQSLLRVLEFPDLNSNVGAPIVVSHPLFEDSPQVPLI